MNPPNPSSGSPATNKLILLVLSGIFVCLVLLVIRAFDRQAAVGPNVVVSVTSTPDAEPAPEIVSVIESTTARRSLTNATRTPVSSLPPQPVEAPAEEAPVSVSQTILLPPATVGRAGSSRSGGANSINVVGGGIIAGNPSVTGTMTLQGQPPQEIPINFGPSCGRFAPPATTRHYVVGPDGELANVFVYIEDAKPTPVLGPGPLLDQVGCMYEPYVLGVGVNQKFGIRNSDPEMHNVHATPRNPANKEFNFAQMAGATVMLKSFANPEVLIRIKCDVHPWMFAYVGVVDHPWFAVSDTNGFYQLPQGLPAGRYRLNAIHLKTGGAQTRAIVVGQDQPVVANFQFTPSVKLSPQTTQATR
jgi:hypothetical protein